MGCLWQFASGSRANLYLLNKPIYFIKILTKNEYYMEVYERLNQILREQKLTKRDFSNRLRSLEPKLKTTGEIPSENTIYSYLSGRITIPIELIPYIAEVLNIIEQELFDTAINYKKYTKFLITYIPVNS